MPYLALHTLVGTALIDAQFRDALLNGERRALLVDFDLTDEEREAVLSIRARSTREFAIQLDRWLQTHERQTAHA